MSLPQEPADTPGPSVAPGVVPLEQRTPKAGSTPRPKKQRKDWFPPNVQQYLACLLLYLIVPLLPLFFEWSNKRSVSVSSWHLTAFSYAISIGVASRNVFPFVFSLVAAVVYASCYGTSMNPGSHAWLIDTWLFPLAGIVVVFLMGAFERYVIHVEECIPYINFRRGDDS
jgi:membrane protease YdiL (CAAX protease family)